MKKDSREFLIRFLDKIVKRLLQSNNANIINYYFKGVYNIN